MSVVSSAASSSTSAGSSSSSAAAPASTQVTPTAPAPDPNLDLGQQIVDYALSFVGTKYVYAGASPSGFDCSGLVSYVYRQFGVSLTRSSAGQYRDNGSHIQRSELAPGDLIFTSSNGRTVTHVAIYMGDNKIVHSARSSGGVVIGNLNHDYYTRTWFGAKRVI